jgi:hypothetical protein
MLLQTKADRTLENIFGDRRRFDIGQLASEANSW